MNLLTTSTEVLNNERFLINEMKIKSERKNLVPNFFKLDSVKSYYIILYKTPLIFQFKRGQIAEFIDVHRLIFNGLLKQNLFFN